MIEPQNLDAMNPDELDAIVKDVDIPANVRGYANVKGDSMRFRAAGFIPEALSREALCDRLYPTLPAEWRW